MEVNPSVPAKTIPEFITYAKAILAKSPWRRQAAEARNMSPANLFKMMAGVSTCSTCHTAGSDTCIDRFARRSGADHVRRSSIISSTYQGW